MTSQSFLVGERPGAQVTLGRQRTILGMEAPNVLDDVLLVVEDLTAVVTLERTFALVQGLVLVELGPLHEAAIAGVALVGEVPGVDALVQAQIGFLIRRVVAEVALVILVWVVSLTVTIHAGEVTKRGVARVALEG